MTTTAPATTVPITLIWPCGEDIADMEITDALIINDTLEQIDIGGRGVLQGVYLRISGPDLVCAFEELRRKCDEAIHQIMDARQDRLDAERHHCWCNTLLEPDEVDCGAQACRHYTAQDAQGLVP